MQRNIQRNRNVAKMSDVQIAGGKVSFAIVLVENPGLMLVAARPPNPDARSSFPPEFVHHYYWYTLAQIKTIKAICFSCQKNGQNLLTLIEVI